MAEFLVHSTELVMPSFAWLACVLLLAAAVHRWTPMLLPGADDPADRLLRRLLLAAVLTAGTTAVLGLAGRLQPLWIVVSVLLLWLASLRIRPAAADCESSQVCGDGVTGDAPSHPLPPLLGPQAWPWLAVAAWIAVDCLAALPAAPVNWDAMTYHLHFPARWVQEGRLFHVPTVFADNTAAYAPQNGALIFAWIMALSASDALCSVVQGLAVLAIVLAVYRLSRQLSPATSPTAAAWAAFLVCALPPVRRWAYTANVDVLMVAAWLAAVSWTVDLMHEPGPGQTSSHRRVGALGAAALAAGFCAGTKTLGLALALPVSLVAVAAWVVGGSDSDGQFSGRRLRVHGPAAVRSAVNSAALFWVLSIAAGGWWFLRNLWLYDNPLFPLDLSFAGLHFAGAFTSATMKSSYFHVPFDVWITFPPAAFGPVGSGLVLLGWLRLAAIRGVAARGLALFVPAWFLYVYGVLPYNSQVRFLLPAVLAALCGLAPTLDRLSPRWQAGTSVAAALGLLLTGIPGTGPLDELPVVARAAGPGFAAWVAAALGLAVAVAFLVRARIDPRRPQSWRGAGAVAAMVCFGALVTLGATAARVSRGALLQRAEYPAIVAFEYEELPPLDIAYTGFNLPYMLSGPGFRHRVVYVNTRGELDDGLYEHWRRDPVLHGTHRPGIYRGADDAELWLSRLDQLGIDAVVVHRFFTLGDVGTPGGGAWGPEWPEDPRGFPQEREWLRRHPERFRLIDSEEWYEIYLVP